jgi:hypothetical protein
MNYQLYRKKKEKSNSIQSLPPIYWIAIARLQLRRGKVNLFDNMKDISTAESCEPIGYLHSVDTVYSHRD